MVYIFETLGNLVHQTAFFNLTWGNFVMILVACVFLYLAIKKDYEPLLLVPYSARPHVKERVGQAYPARMKPHC